MLRDWRVPHALAWRAGTAALRRPRASVPQPAAAHPAPRQAELASGPGHAATSSAPSWRSSCARPVRPGPRLSWTRSRMTWKLQVSDREVTWSSCTLSD